VKNWKLFAYHLEDLRVPLVVRVPQVGNPCFMNRQRTVSFYVLKEKLQQLRFCNENNFVFNKIFAALVPKALKTFSVVVNQRNRQWLNKQYTSNNTS